MADIRVGISGWTHDEWRGTFYPKGTPRTKELDYASRQLSSIELNGTFYSLQKPKSFQEWYSKSPEGFVFSVKAPQFITHVLRLKEVDEPLKNFLASGLLCLKEKLGPILWQFPDYVTLKDNRFEEFLKIIPHDSKAAAALAREHGPKVKGRAWTEAGGDYPIRHAFEFRHPSFVNKDFLSMLHEHGVAAVVAHDEESYVDQPTADEFVYLRLYGGGKTTYSARDLEAWAEKIIGWKRDAFVYLGGEVKDRGPFLAQDLQKKIDALRAKKAA
jgi:uncharacterized protein YecE (DUF72 family)